MFGKIGCFIAFSMGIYWNLKDLIAIMKATKNRDKETFKRILLLCIFNVAIFSIFLIVLIALILEGK